MQMASVIIPIIHTETLRHKKEPSCLKLLNMADGSGDQAPKPHRSNELLGKSLLIPLRQGDVQG